MSDPQAILDKYLSETQELPNESAKTHRFAQLIAELFKGSSATIEFSRGVEKRVRVDSAIGSSHGRIDSLYGNAIIEFENSLAATLSDAEYQLREYAAGVWSERGVETALICIATDGVSWRVYQPIRTKRGGKTVRTEDVRLEELRTLTLSSTSLNEFYLWITALLFRKHRTPPTVEFFRFDFGARSVAFAASMRDLQRAWKKVHFEGEAELKLRTWRRYLAFTYGSLDKLEDLEGLFLKHTYLASVARLLVWATLSHGRTTRNLQEVATSVFDGTFFRKQGIGNLAEDDFFSWITEQGTSTVLAPTWERILDQLLTYDLSNVGNDILKGVYQELVDPKDRHDLGEYYTPDWLCEEIAERMLPKTGFVRVLDPTCGSGSFLRATIVELLRRNPAGGDKFRLNAILRSVVGIEIHPLAVSIARATYALALGPLLRAADRPIQIPVYLADSLFLPVEVGQLELGRVRSYEIRFGPDRKVQVPEDLVRSVDLFDPAIDASAEIARAHAATAAENPETLKAYLRKAIPQLSAQAEYEAIIAALWHFVEELAGLILAERDSIWAFVVRNAYKPAMLKESFDLIVGNPPWLSYRYISDTEYQVEVKNRAVTEYRIAPSQTKLMTQMELATVFLVHCLHVFGRAKATLAFVMPRSILSADQHQTLRSREYRAMMSITDYWDLVDVQPLFNVPTCVVFAERKQPVPTNTYSIPAIEWVGRLPERDASSQVANKTLKRRNRTARLIYVGQRNALSTSEGSTAPTRSSDYRGRFRQGATLVPRNCYFVTVHEPDYPIVSDKLYGIETDPEQARLAKQPWASLKFAGEVEGRYLFRTVMAKHVLPFLLLEADWVFLPFERKGDAACVLNESELRRRGDRKAATWLAAIHKAWVRARGTKNKMSELERIDYGHGLTNQTFGSGALVLYNASGQHLAACAVSLSNYDAKLVVDHKLYWAVCDSIDEAQFLAAILNSEAVNRAIKPFQSLGLLGERDIHKKVLDLPIPNFQPKNADHQRLVKLGQDAAAAVQNLQRRAGLPIQTGRARSHVRAAVPQLAEIDSLTTVLLSR